MVEGISGRKRDEVSGPIVVWHEGKEEGIDWVRDFKSFKEPGF